MENYSKNEITGNMPSACNGMPQLLTAKDVADYFHIRLETVYTWRFYGKLKATKIHGRLLFNINDILEMVGVA